MGSHEQLQSFVCHMGFRALNTDVHKLRSNAWMECLVPHPSPHVFGTMDVMPDGWELRHMESLAVTISAYMSKPVFAVWCILCLEVVWSMKAA